MNPGARQTGFGIGRGQGNRARGPLVSYFGALPGGWSQSAASSRSPGTVAYWAVFLGILFSLVWNSFSSYNEVIYVVILVVGMVAVFDVAANGIRSADRGIAEWIPLGMFLIWAYGFFLGLFQGNPTEAVFRNFAGMSCYLIYYVMRQLRFPPIDLVKLLLLSGGLNILVAFVTHYSVGSRDVVLVDDSMEEFLFENRRFYAQNFVSYLPVIGFLAGVLLVSPQAQMLPGWLHRFAKSPLVLVAMLGFSVYVAMILTLSKGIMLSVLVLAALIFALSFINKSYTDHRNFAPRFFFLSITGLLLVSAMFSTRYGELISKSFSFDGSGNALRYEQAEFLLDNMRWLGWGLGAAVGSGGYARDALGYGFELSFLNVIHKFGVLSLVVFFTYIHAFAGIVRHFARGREYFVGCVALGGLLFLIPAIGNPTLFSPVSVILHCSVIYLISDRNWSAAR